MNKTVNYASALMGSGKTKSLINNIQANERVVIALPTMDLASGVVERFLEESRLNAIQLDSSTVGQEKVKDVVESALVSDEYAEGGVLVITHKTLVAINPELLRNWIVAVDEIPDLLRNTYTNVSFETYHTMFSELVDEEWAEQSGEVLIRDGQRMRVRALFSDAVRRGNKPYEIVLGGLLSRTGHVTQEVGEDNVYFLAHDYYDYASVVINSAEFHLLANGIEKTLLNLFFLAKGFDIKESRFTPSFDGYKMSPTLVPLVEGSKFSKGMMLTREDGTQSEKFDEKCLGWKLMDNALAYHEGHPVIVQKFGWMSNKYFEDKYENAEFTKFDLRGLNNYSHYSRTVNIIHGNPEPIHARMNRTLLEKLGVDPLEGEKAIRHDRLIEPIAQYMLRTDMRNGNTQVEATVTVVPTLEIAKQLEEVLQIGCHIDTSIMLKAPKSAKASSKEGLKEKAKELALTGMKKKDIALELKVTDRTLRNWLKES